MHSRKNTMQAIKHTRRFVSIFITLLAISCMAAAQQRAVTPFDLLPRVQDTLPDDSITIAISSNPFDIVKIRPKGYVDNAAPGFRIEKSKKPRLTAREKEDVYKRFIFIVMLVMVVSLTLAVTFFRLLLVKIWEAFRSDVLLHQLHREQGAGMTLAYSILYLLFLMNAGVFAFLGCRYFNIEIAGTNIASLGILTLGISGYFLVKHLMLRFIGFIFPIRKEVSAYEFTIVIFNIVIGLFLAAGILFLAYSPASTTKYWLYGIAGTVGGIYLFRHLRGMFIAAPFIGNHKFHFLLYLCSVEIAPVVLIAKLLISQGGN